KEPRHCMQMTRGNRQRRGRLSAVVYMIGAGGTCVVLWYGAALVVAGQLTSGDLVVFLFYLGKMYKPMRDLSKMADTASKSVVGIERINEIIGTRDGVTDISRAKQAPRFRGGIEFENVSFSYRAGELVLRNLSFNIKPGQFVALVGPTGGGKSTIIGLIPRFYDPTAGAVRIDGVDIRSFTMKSL